MAYTPETRRAVRGAYVHQALSLKAAAQRFGVAFATASRWKADARGDGDDWDRARAAARLSGEGAEAVTQAVLEEFVTLFQTTMAGLKADEAASPLSKAEALSRLSDAYNKTMSAVAKGSPRLNKLAVAMEVLQKLAGFISERYPQHANALLEVLEPFGEYVTQELG